MREKWKQSEPKEPKLTVILRAPDPVPSHVFTLSGRLVMVGTEGTVEVGQGDAEPVIGQGWMKVNASPYE